MPISHREVAAYGIVIVIVFSILFFYGKLTQDVYLSTIAAITGYVLRDREGYVRRAAEMENGKQGGDE